MTYILFTLILVGALIELYRITEYKKGYYAGRWGEHIPADASNEFRKGYLKAKEEMLNS